MSLTIFSTCAALRLKNIGPNLAFIPEFVLLVSICRDDVLGDDVLGAANTLLSLSSVPRLLLSTFFDSLHTDDSRNLFSLATLLLLYSFLSACLSFRTRRSRCLAFSPFSTRFKTSFVLASDGEDDEEEEDDDDVDEEELSESEELSTSFFLFLSLCKDIYSFIQFTS